jgi:hypothetical protein
MEDIGSFERYDLVQSICCRTHEQVQLGELESGSPTAILERAVETQAFDIFDQELGRSLLG